MKRVIAVAFAVSLLASAVGRADDDPISAAKELYAAAAYEDALTAFAKIAAAGDVAPETAMQIDEYRSFCLIALGRTREAESVAQDMVRRNPLFEPRSEDVSPRVEAVFAQVRKQLLPSLIREKYRAAKAAIDRKAFAEAEPQLLMVREMIARTEQLGVKDESLADLAVLADGFIDLTHAAVAKPAEPVAEPPIAAPAPSLTRTAAATPAPLTKFDAGDPEVTPPVVLRQQLPPVPPVLSKLAVGKKGIVEITIETDGRVGEAVMRESLNGAYDNMVLNATKQWRYKPATKDGVPVRYVKAIALQVQN